MEYNFFLLLLSNLYISTNLFFLDENEIIYLENMFKYVEVYL